MKHSYDIYKKHYDMLSMDMASKYLSLDNQLEVASRISKVKLEKMKNEAFELSTETDMNYEESVNYVINEYVYRR